LFIIFFWFSFEIITSLLFNEKEAFKEILSFEKNINLSEDIFYEFLEINNQNKLIEEKIKFEKSKKPFISVVMMVYNQAYCLHRCLRSIQNQSLKNIEIIIVDDCSLDNSVELIKEYQKEDPRIMLIKHDANRGKIKTRSDGMRKAKGKYIASIDGDDAFIHKDILKNSLYIAEKGNLDTSTRIKN
jgi:cellulose synthase/poly-beta-1,6-N-acetylglucosamine synthase-like glycosyltransferase